MLSTKQLAGRKRAAPKSSSSTTTAPKKSKLKPNEYEKSINRVIRQEEKLWKKKEEEGGLRNDLAKEIHNIKNPGAGIYRPKGPILTEEQIQERKEAALDKKLLNEETARDLEKYGFSKVKDWEEPQFITTPSGAVIPQPPKDPMMTDAKRAAIEKENAGLRKRGWNPDFVDEQEEYDGGNKRLRNAPGFDMKGRSLNPHKQKELQEKRLDREKRQLGKVIGPKAAADREKKAARARAAAARKDPLANPPADLFKPADALMFDGFNASMRGLPETIEVDKENRDRLNAIKAGVSLRNLTPAKISAADKKATEAKAAKKKSTASKVKATAAKAKSAAKDKSTAKDKSAVKEKSPAKNNSTAKDKSIVVKGKATVAAEATGKTEVNAAEIEKPLSNEKQDNDKSISTKAGAVLQPLDTGKGKSVMAQIIAAHEASKAAAIPADKPKGKATGASGAAGKKMVSPSKVVKRRSNDGKKNFVVPSSLNSQKTPSTSATGKNTAITATNTSKTTAPKSIKATIEAAETKVAAVTSVNASKLDAPKSTIEASEKNDTATTAGKDSVAATTKSVGSSSKAPTIGNASPSTTTKSVGPSSKAPTTGNASPFIAAKPIGPPTKETAKNTTATGSTSKSDASRPLTLPPKPNVVSPGSTVKKTVNPVTENVLSTDGVSKELSAAENLANLTALTASIKAQKQLEEMETGAKEEITTMVPGAEESAKKSDEVVSTGNSAIEKEIIPGNKDAKPTAPPGAFLFRNLKPRAVNAAELSNLFGRGQEAVHMSFPPAPREKYVPSDAWDRPEENYRP